MKSTMACAGAAALGVVLGFVSALAVLNNGHLHGQIEHDHWIGNNDTGSSAAGPYTRGIVATTGLLALNRLETIYFHRYVDDHDTRFREGCTYELSGGDLPARWWSITVYATDDFLPVNGDGALSIDASRITRGANGRWVTHLAADRAGAINWISTRNAGEFNLALRMYNPHERALSEPSRISYPQIRRVVCDESVS